ncbi:MAG TPA: DUF2314 domain-containing protein, partial [Polyangiaceae bacterium]
MSRRTLVYIGIGIAVLAFGRLLSTSGTTQTPEPPAGSGTATASVPVSPSATAAPRAFKRPPSAMAELGILTDRPEAELEALIDRESLAARVMPKHCGDAAACEAVRATLRDGHATALEVVPSGDWSLERANVDAGARGLSAAEKAKVGKMPRIVVVHVTMETTPGQLALRTALAVTAAIAEKIDGVVWDQLLERFERPHDFAAHAVTTPLGESAFRRDRIEILYEPKDEGIVRVLTSGLSRWGAPDVDAAAVPTAASARVSEIVLGVAEAIANGATTGPISLSRDDLGRARGQAYPTDAGLPESSAVPIDVVSVHPEGGDPNDFIARIEPAAGDGPIAYVDLAERFFGTLLAASPDADAMSAKHKKAQAQLGAALAQWDASRTSGGKLLVLLPFGIPGDAGIESMWVEVTRFDARTVTGRLVDDPLGAVDVARGDEVTRPRTEVEDL